MRKTLFWLFSMVLFCTLPALAQHGHGSNGHSNNAGHTSFGGHGSVTHSESHPATRQGRGYSYARGDEHGGGRAHWGNGRFEDHFFVSHWGARNRFFWGGCNWYGPRYYPGSYFWFNGAYFVIVDAVDPLWYDGEVYVDYIDGGYYLVNPAYPGVRFAIEVRF